MKSIAAPTLAPWRRVLLGMAASALVAAGSGEAPVARAAGANYPERSIKIVVPFAAGNQIDIHEHGLTLPPEQFGAEIRDAVARRPAIVKAEGFRVET